MINSFQFARLPKIFFGNGKISELPGIVKTLGKSIVLVTGERSFVDSSHAQILLGQFKAAGIGYEIVTISKEPTVEIIDQSVSRFRDESVEAVVGIGGGSVLDAGKAISAMLNRSESVEDFLEGVGTKEHPGTKIPFIAVPTTAGTGSEATKNAVISKTGVIGFKKSLRHDHFVPDVAIVDPVLTINCPRQITVACGMDCFVQLTESYLSTGANPFSDALAIQGLKAVKSSLVKCVRDGRNTEARTDMAFAALTSGICLANAGLGVIHGFASSLGGMYDIPHGVICGSLMAISNEINVRELRKRSDNQGALKKYAELGRLFLDQESKTDDYYIDGFITYLHNLSVEFQLPGLKQYGINHSDLEKICKGTGMKNNPVNLSFDDLMEIIISRLL
jgi:alcohol dehydrogenase class IV